MSTIKIVKDTGNKKLAFPVVSVVGFAYKYVFNVCLYIFNNFCCNPVSYTHLDVYKRQMYIWPDEQGAL